MHRVPRRLRPGGTACEGAPPPEGRRDPRAAAARLACRPLLDAREALPAGDVGERAKVALWRRRPLVGFVREERLVKEERDRLDDDAVELGVVRLVDDSAARLGPRPLLGGRAEGVLEDEVLHQVRLVVAARSHGRDV